MTLVHFSGLPDDAGPCIREAVAALGYFEASRTDDLIELYRQLWPSGLSATTLIYNNLGWEELSQDVKDEANFGRGRMPRIVWELLTDKGRSDPRHAIKATHLRMIFNYYRARDAKQEHWAAGIASRVTLSAKVDACCAINRERNGMVIQREDRFPLPLPDCTAEWCPCRWDNVPDSWED